MYTKPLNGLSKKSVGIAGGKGASLGEMIGAGFPVPGGFVVTSATFHSFLRNSALESVIAQQLHAVDHDDVFSVEKASKEIRNLFKKAVVPEDLRKELLSEYGKLNAKFVAVRSSATAEDSAALSWAGELESHLNTTDVDLIDNVKKCWSSLFTPRAIKYCKEHGLSSDKIGVAVVVQEMVDAVAAGVCFTVHPVTKDRNMLHIESAWGLGEAVVSGSVTPDAYVVDKKELIIEEIVVGEQKKKVIRSAKGATMWVPVEKGLQRKQKLAGREIMELAGICMDIERHYKKPQDIEWAYRDGRFFIVQSRPITTL